MVLQKGGSQQQQKVESVEIEIKPKCNKRKPKHKPKNYPQKWVVNAREQT